MRKMGIVCGWILIVTVWILCAVFDLGGQRSLFFREGTELLTDYWMPKTCLVEGYGKSNATDETLGKGGNINWERVESEREESKWVDGKMFVAKHDRCYPATALMPLYLFPATWKGAWAWTISVAVLFVLSLCLIARSWWPLLLFGSMPVIFNLERGNPIGVSAACVGVFLAWYGSERKWQRIVAAFALSVATCFKISPVVLGVLYLPERDWKGIGWCVGFCTALFFIPWCFIPDGFAALPVMLENAKFNFMAYARCAEFGIVDIWRAVRVVLHQDCMYLWPGCLWAVRVSQLLGFCAVVGGAWKRRPLWVVVGMLWAAGNMHYYGALYLLPLFVLELADVGVKRMSVVRLCLWFVVLCPLQLMVFGHSANAILCNLAAIGLMSGYRQFS